MERGAPGTRAEIPLGPMEKQAPACTMLDQISMLKHTLEPMVDKVNMT